MLVTAGAQLAPIVSEASAVGQFVAPAHRRLSALAQNLWWSWDNDTTSLFRELDPALWRSLDNNPVALLQQIPIEKLEERASELALHSRINYAYRRMKEYLNSTHTWGARHAGVLWARPVAYFSAEFGLHESIPIYSGGLGILAGDHIKSASDLGVPLVGVGLYYDQGYFRQRLDADGWQHEDYIDVDHAQLPIQAAVSTDAPVHHPHRDPHRNDSRARLEAGCRPQHAAAARLERRGQSARRPRAHGTAVRRRQPRPHPAGAAARRRRHARARGARHFARCRASERRPQRVRGLELVRQRMDDGRHRCHRSHPPRVRADRVHDAHAGPGRPRSLPLVAHRRAPRSAARVDGHQPRSLHGARPRQSVRLRRRVLHDGARAASSRRRANAVSSLHGQVSRAMWVGLFPGIGEEQVPIGHITNGVHVQTWLAPQMRQVYDRHLGPDWPQRASDARLLGGHRARRRRRVVGDAPDAEGQLVEFARRRVVRQAERRGEAPRRSLSSSARLSVDALTIGFARRFATYKRANLLLQDIDAIAALVNDPQMPVQFVFAGKSHPHDGPGKAVLQQIAQLMRDPRFAGKLLFIEDYDINVGRHLVQGVDVWVNNPRRPLEACGTSGQKVVLNGGLNLSILDGWWAEAYDGLNGFAIGMGETHTNVGDARYATTDRRCSRRCATRSFRSTTNATRTACRARGSADEARHPHARLALQRRSDGDGLRAQGLHPGGRRHELRRLAIMRCAVTQSFEGQSCSVAPDFSLFSECCISSH